MTFEKFAGQRTVLLTTYRKDGTPVGTTVNIVVEDNHAYIRTWKESGKAKRIWNNPIVEVAPSTFRGRPTGTGIRAHARKLTGDEGKHASKLIRRKYRLMHGILVPLTHFLARHSTVHYELLPID